MDSLERRVERLEKRQADHAGDGWPWDLFFTPPALMTQVDRDELSKWADLFQRSSITDVVTAHLPRCGTWPTR